MRRDSLVVGDADVKDPMAEVEAFWGEEGGGRKGEGGAGVVAYLAPTEGGVRVVW